MILGFSKHIPLLFGEKLKIRNHEGKLQIMGRIHSGAWGAHRLSCFLSFDERFCDKWKRTSSTLTCPFRLVCTNGLIVGARIAAINIRHMGHTGEDVIAASLQLASETPRIMDDIHRMQGVELPYKRQVDFVHEAAQLRMGDDYEDRIRPEALLSPRRWNDIGFTAGGPATVWQCFNRVQENLIRGGVPMKPWKDGVHRRRSLRALNGIDGNTRLNRELWDLADSYTLNN